MQISLTDEERTEVEGLIRARNTPQKVVLRARIILLSADMVPTSEISERLQTTYPTITRWRRRYAEQGVAGICKDAARPGRKPRISAEQVREVVERTLHSTPLNGTHWSTRTMAAATGLSKATVQRLWRAHGLQPRRTETFKLSRDPHFLEKLQDVAGLYLDPPEKAIVFSVDEKSHFRGHDTSGGERGRRGLPPPVRRRS